MKRRPDRQADQKSRGFKSLGQNPPTLLHHSPKNPQFKPATIPQPPGLMKYLSALILVVLGLGFSSCGSSVGLDGGSGYSSAYANSTDIEKARRITKEVFAEEGFIFIGASHSTLSFQKEGGASAQVVWGSYGHRVMIRPDVLVQQQGSRILLDCELYLSSFNGDDRKPWLAGKGPYKRLMREIKRRIES